MGLFQHKKDKAQAGLSPNPPEFTPSEPVGEGRAACMNRLEVILGVPSSRSVVLKLYLESSKSLSKIFGHECCEELLSQITGYLTEPAGGSIYRYISVGFIAVLEQFDKNQASDPADETPERLGSVWKIWNTDCLCSTQAGLCSYPGYATAVDELIKCLGLAVASAIECGPSQTSVYDNNMHTQFVRRQTTVMYLQTALEKHELEVRYRPTYNLRESRLTRAGSYTRISIQGIGLMGAGESPPIAKGSGQIRAIGYYVLDHAGQCIADLIASGKEFDFIRIPMSPILLVQEDFTGQIRPVIEKHDIPEHKLALEIDDSAFLSVCLDVSITMQELCDVEVESAVNDFGSGCVPATSILDLSIHTIKLERVFVWQLGTNPKLVSVAGGLIQIAKEFGIHITVEGVETENQPNAPNSYPYEYQQGFYYASTMELDVLKKVLGTIPEESWTTTEEEKIRMKR